MQCVQAAIINQLKTIKKLYPDKKVGVVTFNNDVQIIGDGMQDPYIIAGDNLKDYKFLC